MSFPKCFGFPNVCDKNFERSNKKNAIRNVFPVRIPIKYNTIILFIINASIKKLLKEKTKYGH